MELTQDVWEEILIRVSLSSIYQLWQTSSVLKKLVEPLINTEYFWRQRVLYLSGRKYTGIRPDVLAVVIELSTNFSMAELVIGVNISDFYEFYADDVEVTTAARNVPNTLSRSIVEERLVAASDIVDRYLYNGAIPTTADDTYILFRDYPDAVSDEHVLLDLHLSYLILLLYNNNPVATRRLLTIPTDERYIIEAVKIVLNTSTYNPSADVVAIYEELGYTYRYYRPPLLTNDDYRQQLAVEYDITTVDFLPAVYYYLVSLPRAAEIFVYLGIDEYQPL